MSCPRNQPQEIRLCSQKTEEKGLRSMLDKYKLERKATAFSVHPKKSANKKITIKKQTKKLKIKKRKKTNKKTTKTATQKKCKKRCPQGSRCNNKTGRCRKTQKKRKKRKKLTTIIKNTTPSLNKELRLMTTPSIKKEKAAVDVYSPSINRALISLRQISPHPDIFNCIKNREIRVETKKGPKCVGWKTKKAQETMLDNLLSNKKIIASHIIAPKQALANCWFNTLFMTFFISDKGRKFNRVFRQMMITGNLIKRNKSVGRIAKQLQWPFFLLNKYIDASLRGTDDPSRFAELMDTNILIRQIHNAAKKLKKQSNRHHPTIAKTGQPYNPLTFDNIIMNYLYDPTTVDASPIWKREFRDENWKKTTLPHLIRDGAQGEAPHILYLKYSDNFPHRVGEKAPRTFSFNIKKSNNTQVVKYTLDAAILRDINKKHFSAYLTINGKDYAFDGESFSRIESFQWKNKLYKNTQWRFAEQYDTYFNFTKGYQILMYYRIA